MELKRVRVQLLEEQVDFLLKLLDANEPSDEDIPALNAWYFSKIRLNQAKTRCK